MDPEGSVDDHRLWKRRLGEAASACRGELRRVARIGGRMLAASKTNSSLHDSYERLGRLAAKAVKDGRLAWDDPEAAALLERIESCRGDLESIEEEVGEIRFSPPPGGPGGDGQPPGGA